MTCQVLFEPAAVRELAAAADFYDLEQFGLGTAFQRPPSTTAGTGRGRIP
jgi:hypothetical protein